MMTILQKVLIVSSNQLIVTYIFILII